MSVGGAGIQASAPQKHGGRDAARERPLPKNFAGVGVERVHGAVETSEEDPVSLHGGSRASGVWVGRVAGCKLPDQRARFPVQAEELVLERDGIDVRIDPLDICADSGGHLILPARLTRVPFEGVQVRDGAVAAGDDEVFDDERIRVELDRSPVLLRVVTPPHRARLLLECPKESVAGADQDEVPRDRGGGEDSTAGVVSPKRPRIGHGFRGLCRTLVPRGGCHEEHHHQERGNAQRPLHPSRTHHGLSLSTVRR